MPRVCARACVCVSSGVHKYVPPVSVRVCRTFSRQRPLLREKTNDQKPRQRAPNPCSSHEATLRNSPGQQQGVFRVVHGGTRSLWPIPTPRTTTTTESDTILEKSRLAAARITLDPSAAYQLGGGWISKLVARSAP